MAARRAAVARAAAHAPFLARLADRYPADIARFVATGTAAARAAIAPPALTADGAMAALRQWRGRTALVLALGDLAGELDGAAVTRALTDFADAACDAALALAVAAGAGPAIGPAPGLAVIALGKMGSHELNYSSDIDPILLFDPAVIPRRPRDDPAEAAVRIGRRMIEYLSARTSDGHVLRVDLRLRPNPEVTPIVLPVDAAISYYESAALPWEQAAFIRARAAAGDRTLGQRFLAAIPAFVWRKSVDYRQLQEIGSMSERIRDHYAGGQAFGPGYDLKRGRGGIREVEFFAQVHQLIFGGRDPSLRAPATGDALAALAAAGRVAPDLARQLISDYWTLRRIEHRLQMVEDQQTHALPMDPAVLDGVARLDGLADGAALLALLAPVVARVAAAYDQLVTGRAAAAGWPGDAAALARHVEAAGFRPPDAALARIAEWRSGHLRVLRSPAARASLEKVLPSLIRALGAAPDPAAALAGFDRMIGGLPSAIDLFHLLAAEPKLARIVTEVLALAPTLAAALAVRPALIEGLIDAAAFAPPPGADALTAEWAGWAARLDYEKLLDHIRAAVGEARFAYGVQLIGATRDPLAVGRGYAALAEAAIEVLADATAAAFAAQHGRVPGGELVVLAMGRLGGGVLTHASDLDLIYLFTGDHLATSDGPRPLGATQYFNRLAQRLTAALSVPTAAGRLYEVDTRLRPSGAQGPLAVSVDSFARYQRQEAWTFEHMALARARVVYGSAAARAEVAAVLADVLGRARPPGPLIADIAAMRARMAEHKPPSGPLDVKLGRGGLVDLEFGLAAVQLAAGTPFPTPLVAATAQAEAMGTAPPGMARAATLLESMLILLRLTGDGAAIAASPAAQAAMAASCGHADWPSLIAAHDAARDAVAAWWEQICVRAVPSPDDHSGPSRPEAQAE